MPARDDRNLRFELVRLYQAIEQTKRGRSQTSPHAGSLLLNGRLRGERTTCILRGIEENRRERVRLRERLPFQYSENLSRVHRRSLMSAKRPEEGLLEWLLDVTEERTPDSQKASGMRLRIHCEESKRGWVYLVGLLGSGPPDSHGSAVRRMDLSSSGICFPTERSHERGDGLAIVLYLPSDRNPLLRLGAEVVRQSQPLSSGGVQTAVRFVEISRDDQERILDYILARHSQRLIEKTYRGGS